jgi:hypothetical protein
MSNKIYNHDKEQRMQTKLTKSPRLSSRTQAFWTVDTTLIVSGIIASLSGIYFLIYPTGNRRTALLGDVLPYTRRTWDAWHTWTGAVMIAIAVIHLIIHLNWVSTMAKRMWKMVIRGSKGFNLGGWINLIIDGLVAVGFFLTAASGVYFLAFPGSGHGVEGAAFIFDSHTWDAIHTWGFVVFIAAAIFHFIIHWRWVKNVSRKVVLILIDPFQRSPHSAVKDTTESLS